VIVNDLDYSRDDQPFQPALNLNSKLYGNNDDYGNDSPRGMT